MFGLFQNVLLIVCYQVESQQTMIRIVGLSATLPNYIDVASFLHVNPYQGLFYFDSRFRPVPLGLTFCGIKAMSRLRQMEEMDKLAYDKALRFVETGDQVSLSMEISLQFNLKW